MNESILLSIKKVLGGYQDTDAFDQDIIMAINTALNALTQIGVGPASGFIITDNSETWSDFVGEDIMLSMVKTYVGLMARKIFDPPANSTAMQAINELLDQYTFRISVQVDPARSIMS